MTIEEPGGSLLQERQREAKKSEDAWRSAMKESYHLVKRLGPWERNPHGFIVPFKRLKGVPTIWMVLKGKSYQNGWKLGVTPIFGKPQMMVSNSSFFLGGNFIYIYTYVYIYIYLSSKPWLGYVFLMLIVIHHNALTGGPLSHVRHEQPWRRTLDCCCRARAPWQQLSTRFRLHFEENTWTYRICIEQCETQMNKTCWAKLPKIQQYILENVPEVSSQSSCTPFDPKLR